MSSAILAETKVRTLGTHADALPYLFQAQPEMGRLADWTAANEATVLAKLYRHGAVLFRGFGVSTQQAFEDVARTISHGLVAEGGEHKRLSQDSQVYTPVDYPADQFLMWHNEDSFNPQWPSKILFCCAKAPAQGGATPVTDSRDVYHRLRPELRKPFEEKGVIYHRTYGMGLGRSWKDIFRTEDPAEVEAFCRANDIRFEWREDGSLVTRQKRSAVARHLVTGEKVWFTQAQHWHPACLDSDTRESLEALYGEDDMPRNCLYGDGTPIPDEVMLEICEAYRELTTFFPWQVGDVMVVDNVLAAHARNAYVGERKLLVALGELSGDYGLGRLPWA